MFKNKFVNSALLSLLAISSIAPGMVMAEEQAEGGNESTVAVTEIIQHKTEEVKNEGVMEILGIKIYLDKAPETYRSKYFKDGLEGLETVFNDMCKKYSVDPDLALAVSLTETSMGTNDKCTKNYNYGIPDTSEEPIVFESKAEGVEEFIHYLAITPEEVLSTLPENAATAAVATPEATPEANPILLPAVDKDKKKEEKAKNDMVDTVEEISFKYQTVGFSEMVSKIMENIRADA